VDAADHPATWGSARNLLDLSLAIDGKHRYAELVGGSDLALLLDGVAVGDPASGGAGSQHLMGLVDRGYIETTAELDQEL
jgi:hypothetical protein